MSEVRWCTACASASAIVTRVVQVEHEVSLAGLATRTDTLTRQRFRCQACGAAFELRPAREAITMIALGAIFLAAVTGLELAVAAQAGGDAAVLAVLVGIFALFQIPFGAMIALGVRWRRVARRHAVVADAPVPALRYPELDPAAEPRRCARCGGAAPLETTEQRRVQGIPMGTTWTYRCATCAQPFTLVSRWRAMRPALVVVTALAAAVERMVRPGAAPWWTLLVLAGVGVIVTASAHLSREQRRRHPPATPTATRLDRR